MHTYILTRGNQFWVDQFIKELQGKYLPYEIKSDKCFNNGYKKGILQFQIGVRPIQLWEIVYPKEQIDLVHNTLFETSDAKPQHAWQEKHIFAMRKLLRLKKIPAYDKTRLMPITRQNIEVVGIGIKEDRISEAGTEML